MRVLDPATLDFRRWIGPGARVAWGQGLAEPVTLSAALCAQAEGIGGVSAFVGATFSDTLSGAGALALASYIAMGANGSLIAQGRMQVLPVPYSRLAAAVGPVDLLLVSLAEAPDGILSYALGCEYLHDLAQTARVILGEINSRSPRTPCMVSPPLDRIAGVIRTDRPLPLLAESPDSEANRRLAAHAAACVPEGATLQIGIGSLPDAVLAALAGHRDLGVHSGAIGDRVADLIEAGAVTNALKRHDAGKTVAGILFGTRRIVDFAGPDSGILLAPTSYTHDQRILAAQPRLVAINSAVEVDLSGQINAEAVGGRYIGGVGGAGEFARAAAASEGGVALTVLPSTGARGSASRIVQRLSGPVTVGRADAGIIVTEHGAADLRGLTLDERRRALLAIADPAFRDALAAGPSAQAQDRPGA